MSGGSSPRADPKDEDRGTQVRRRDDVPGRLGPDEGGRFLSLRKMSLEEREIGPKRLGEGGAVTGSPMVPPSGGETRSEEAYF